MPDDTTAATTVSSTTLSIPDDTRDQFPELVEMILASQSMDEEERQYWLDVLPIMSEEQVDNLREILTNEQKQLEEVNKNYGTEEEAPQNVAQPFNEEVYMAKKRERVETERLHREEHGSHDDNLMKDLEGLNNL